MDLGFELPDLHDVADGTASFLKGAVYGAIEMPLDGVTQLINNATPLNLPQIDLVEPQDNLLFKAGVVAGLTVDAVLISRAVNVGLAGYAAPIP